MPAAQKAREGLCPERELPRNKLKVCCRYTGSPGLAAPEYGVKEREKEVPAAQKAREGLCPERELPRNKLKVCCHYTTRPYTAASAVKHARETACNFGRWKEKFCFFENCAVIYISEG